MPTENKTCHRDRIARQTAPSAATANINADANADAGGSTIALPGLCPDELKMKFLLLVTNFIINRIVTRILWEAVSHLSVPCHKTEQNQKI